MHTVEQVGWPEQAARWPQPKILLDECYRSSKNVFFEKPPVSNCLISSAPEAQTSFDPGFDFQSDEQMEPTGERQPQISVRNAT
jgi:hypothetical protein